MVWAPPKSVKVLNLGFHSCSRLLLDSSWWVHMKFFRSALGQASTSFLRHQPSYTFEQPATAGFLFIALPGGGCFDLRCDFHRRAIDGHCPIARMIGSASQLTVHAKTSVKEVACRCPPAINFAQPDHIRNHLVLARNLELSQISLPQLTADNLDLYSRHLKC